jgi:myo-inositol 2-dehydrogenase / D-chiro-inositol 1-dehydrogenase
MTTSDPLNFAVIGCGTLARSQHIPNLAASKKATLYMCCDLSQEVLARCQTEHGARHTTGDFRHAINDEAVDAVLIATTEKLRLPLIQAAADAGKPVYVEKPLARTLDEVEAIRKVVKRAGIPFCVGHNRRSSPAMLEAYGIFRGHMDDPKPCAWRFNREGEGRPRLVEDGVAAMSVRINDDWHSWKGWVFDPQQAPHGPMLFEMTHFTDLCNWFLDAEPVEVSAFETGRLNSTVMIRYATGELASITMCANGSFGYPKELYEMMGHGGVVVVDHMLEVRTAGIQGAVARKRYPILFDTCPQVGAPDGFDGWFEKKRALTDLAAKANDPDRQLGPHGGLALDADKGHAHALERFIDEINGDGPEVCGVDAAVSATRVAFAAIRSAEEGRVVRLAEL